MTNGDWHTHCANALSMNSSISSVILESIVELEPWNSSRGQLVKKYYRRHACSGSQARRIHLVSSEVWHLCGPSPPSSSLCVSFIAKPHRNFQNAHAAFFSPLVRAESIIQAQLPLKQKQSAFHRVKISEVCHLYTNVFNNHNHRRYARHNKRGWCHEMV